MVERFNRTLLAQLRAVAADDLDNWERYLPYVLYAYRAMPHESTRFSPYYLMYGREPAVSLDSALATRMDISPNYEVYQRQFLDKMERMQAQVLKNIERAQAKQKEYYDKKAIEKN